MITTDSIHRILIAMGVHPETAGLFTPHLYATAVKWGVSVAALPMSLAQLAHESALFERAVENLNYTSAKQIRKTWPRRFANNSAAVAFVRKPERLANFVYANRLGNGDAASGDGWKYRGRGLIQVTGKDNYRDAGESLGLPLLEEPELLEEPVHAADAAGWFWKQRDLNQFWDMVTYCTRAINGGLNGLPDRIRLYERASAAALPAAGAEVLGFGAEQ